MSLLNGSYIISRGSSESCGHSHHHSPSNVLLRARLLQSEIESLHNHLKQKKAQLQIVAFLSHVRSELGTLESRASSGKLYEPGGLSGTNLLYLETVWNAAKHCKGLVGFSRRIYWVPPPRGRYKKSLERQQEAYTSKEKIASSVVVDVIAEDGAKWIKISTLTPKRLMYEMAEKGLGSEDLLEMQNEGLDFLDNSYSDDDDKLSIIKLAEDLMKAALATRIKYKHPKVQLILPRLPSNEVREVDVILEQIRAMGVEVDCGTDVPNIPLNLSLQNGLLKEQRKISETVNVDCTILLALISDISHTSCLNESWFNRETQRQVEGEDQQKLLPSMIYPILEDHSLVCTSEAAVRMREIVDVVATPSERQRAHILMGDDPTQNHSQRIQEWRQLSCYEVSKALQLPVKIVEAEDPQSIPSPIGHAVMEKLTKIKSSQVTISVLMYGWAAQQTTVTSNAVAVKALNKAFEEQPPGQEVEGPDIWVCPIPRSLAGKEREKGPLRLRPPKHGEIGHGPKSSDGKDPNRVVSQSTGSQN